MNQWIEEFFAEDNNWDFNKIVHATPVGYPEPLQSRLKQMIEHALAYKTPYILPKLDHNKTLWFYLITHNSRELVEIKNIMQAYLGRVNTIIDPVIYDKGDDKSENIIINNVPHGFIKLNIPPELSQSHKETVYEILQTLTKVIEQYQNRPVIYSTIKRSVGRILRDFFVACDNQDKKAVEQFYEELKESGQLNAANLLSLEFQKYAAGNQWIAIIEHPRLKDISSLKYSNTIVEILLKTLLHTKCKSTNPNDHDIEDLSSALSELSPIFYRPPKLPDSDEFLVLWKIWAIGAFSLGYTEVYRYLPKILLDDEWTKELYEWAVHDLPKESLQQKKISESLHYRTSISTEKSASEASEDTQPTKDNAIALLKESLTCSQQECLDIYNKLNTYPSHIISDIVNHHPIKILYEDLNGRFNYKSKINNWFDWLNRLVEDANNITLLEIANEDSLNWSVNNWDENKIIDLLDKLDEKANNETFRDVLPILLKWLVFHRVKVSADFIERILLSLATDDIYSIQDLALMTDYFTLLNNSTYTISNYNNALVALETCWDKVKSIRSVDSVIETFDGILEGPCPNKNAIVVFWNSVQQFCINEWFKLSEQQKLLLKGISEEILDSSDHLIVEKEEEEAVVKPDFSGKKLAIYTLTEGAGKRAKAVLTELFSGLEVILNHDKVATKALENLASTSDYFIFSAKSASHQAFYPVTNIRDDIIYPTGKGSSSIVRCFDEYAQSLVT